MNERLSKHRKQCAQNQGDEKDHKLYRKPFDMVGAKSMGWGNEKNKGKIARAFHDTPKEVQILSGEQQGVIK